MRRNQTIIVAVVALFVFSCTKKPEVAVVEPVAETPVEDVVEEDSSELGQFRKARKKVRKRKKTKPATPPTRQDGLAALEEGKQLVEEADFRAAERELRIAAAAGVDGADALLFRVRGEISAEDRIAGAQKKIAVRDFEGARAELARVPDGYILSEIARGIAQRLEQREVDARRELLDRAAQKFESADAATGPAPDAPKPEEKPADPPAEPKAPAPADPPPAEPAPADPAPKAE